MEETSVSPVQPGGDARLSTSEMQKASSER
jgi:hypothetical protein